MQNNHFHIHGLYVALGEFEFMNQRMGEERTPLIRLHKHALAVQPDAVLVLFLTEYDFFECHKIGRFAPLVSGLAREESRKTHVLSIPLRRDCQNTLIKVILNLGDNGPKNRRRDCRRATDRGSCHRSRSTGSTRGNY